MGVVGVVEEDTVVTAVVVTVVWLEKVESFYAILDLVRTSD